MGDPRGRPEIREALAEYLARARGVRASPDSIVIGAGARHGVELITKVFDRPPIAVEAYFSFFAMRSGDDAPTVRSASTNTAR